MDNIIDPTTMNNNMYNNVLDPATSVDDNVIDPITTVDDNVHDPIITVDDNVHDPIITVDDNVHDPITTVDDNVHDPITTVDDNVHDPLTTVDNNVHDPITTVDDNVHDPLTTVDNNVHDPITTVDDNVHDPITTVDDNVHDPITVDDNVHDPITVDNNVLDPITTVDDNIHDPITVDNNVLDPLKNVDNNILDPTDTFIPDPAPTVNNTAHDKTLMMDIALDPNLSLREKLNAHISKKKHHGVKPKAHIVNRCAPWWYFAVSGGVAYWGLTEVLPFLYGRWGYRILLANQLFGIMVFLEMAINWICIRHVDSTYIPSIHGIKPPEFAEIGKNITNKKGENLKQYGIKREHLENGNSEKFKPLKVQKLYKMFVATSLPDAYGNVERSAVPYWSWVACVVCKKLRPPRCHHCVLCNRCVLKRDHHCYFAQACIGVNNLRHFIVFLFWAFVGCLWSWLNMLPYIQMELLPNISYLDILPPYSFVRWVLGYQDFLVCVLTFLGWMLTVFLVFTGIQFSDSVILLLKGVTSFEQDNHIVLVDSRSKVERLHAVFGHYWMLNFLFPCHMFFKPLENAVQWPDTKL